MVLLKILQKTIKKCKALKFFHKNYQLYSVPVCHFKQFRMDYLIIAVFLLPMVLMILPMSLIVKYLNTKAIIKRTIQDQIKSDLAMVTIVYVYFYCSMIIAREIFGPLESLIVLDTALWILQCIFNTGFNCIISLVFIQFSNIFGLTVLNDWQESHRLILTRLLVFPLGIVIGSVLCSFGGGSCRKSPLYNHFIIDSLKTDVVKTSLLSGISWISYGIIILICQISVEVKRFLLNKADQRADKLALNAKRDLQQAASKLKIQTTAEFGIDDILSDLQHSTHGLHSNGFQHFTATVVAQTLKRVLPHAKRDQNCVYFEKGPEGQQLPDHNQYQDDKDTVGNKQLVNVEIGMSSLTENNLDDVVSVIEEVPVQEISRNLGPDNNLRQNKHLNNIINVSSEGLHRGAFQAWQQNDILNSELIENQQILDSDVSKKSSSRDRVSNI
jgi:hypothetical protein